MTDKYLYGEETEKALLTFGRGEIPFPLIKAYGEVKKAVIMAQQEVASLYTDEIYEKILSAIDQIIAGDFNNQFPLPLKQGGAGTSLHMNLNEVICGITGEPNLHPLDHLAKFQSTNDTFSTAVTIMVYRFLVEIEETVISLQEILVSLEEKYNSILMVGRTELQDALPITLGQIFASWSGAIERDRWRLHKLKERLRVISLGGTAIGTCFSAPRQYVFKAEQNLRKITALPLCRNQNLTDGINNQDILGEVASGFKLLGLNLQKITSDLLLYTSSFCGELIHPEFQFGSTIMAAKTNPVSLELVNGLAVSLKHHCQAIEDYTSMGQMQLNAYLPFIAESFIDVHSDMIKATRALSEKFFPAMKINNDRISKNLLNSPALLNTLRAVLSYSKIKELISIIQSKDPQNLNDLCSIIAENTDLSIDFLTNWFDLSNLTTYSNFTKDK